MTDLEFPEPQSSLGERLLVAVRNLWTRANQLQRSQEATNKVIDHQGMEIEQIKAEIFALRCKIHGLKVSRGKAMAKNARLLQQITEAESGLSELEHHVH
jgi:septal ring factor EnvC (AmiA/AmiB activator)